MKRVDMAIFSIRRGEIAPLAVSAAPAGDSILREKARNLRLFFERFRDEEAFIDREHEKRCRMLLRVNDIYVLRVTTKDIEEEEKTAENWDARNAGYIVVDTRDIAHPAFLMNRWASNRADHNASIVELLLKKWNVLLSVFGLGISCPDENEEPTLSLPFPFDEEVWTGELEAWAQISGTSPEAPEEPQPQAPQKSKKSSGAPKTHFAQFVADPKNVDRYQNAIQEVLKGKKGKKGVQVIRAAVKMNWLTENPSFPSLEQALKIDFGSTTYSDNINDDSQDKNLTPLMEALEAAMEGNVQ